MDRLDKRFECLINTLKGREIRMSSAEQVSIFADALSAEWNEIVINLKKDSRFSNFGLKEIISKLNSYKFEREERKKELLKGITKNLKNKFGCDS
ncbi:hypothetical protein Hanom_Chr06g00529661 [Helianthus anomalus]